MLLAPILPERSLAMLYAPRGIGKSWLGLTIGLAVASGGSVLRWSAPKPRRVLLVDGEMMLCDLQARLNLILAGLGTAFRMTDFVCLPPTTLNGASNLSSGEGQQELERHLDGVDLLILDNLSTLLATGSEGASDAWLPMQNWLLKLRRQRRRCASDPSCGVNGRQRGTSRREDALGYSNRPAASGGLFARTRRTVRSPHRKSPGFGGRRGRRRSKRPWSCCTTEAGNAAIRWMARDLKPSVFEQAAALFQEGRSVRQVRMLSGHFPR